MTPEPDADFAGRNRAVFVISVAAELTGVHPQTLRVYERKGLLRPARTGGMSRRYSQADVDRIHHIQQLTTEGLNLAGVKRVLEMEREIAELHQKIGVLESRRSVGVEEHHELVAVRHDIVVFEPKGRPKV